MLHSPHANLHARPQSLQIQEATHLAWPDNEPDENLNEEDDETSHVQPELPINRVRAFHQGTDTNFLKCSAIQLKQVVCNVVAHNSQRKQDAGEEIVQLCKEKLGQMIIQGE